MIGKMKLDNPTLMNKKADYDRLLFVVRRTTDREEAVQWTVSGKDEPVA